MEVRLQKWGNSNGIRIPNIILKTLNLKPNDKVEIREENEQIIISKIKKQHVTLDDRIKKYKGSNMAKDFCWDEPQGREICS